MPKALDYGDRMKADPRWVVESTGGGFSGWSRPLDDGGTVENAMWLLTHGEGHAPPENRKGLVQLSLEFQGTTIAYAECRGTAEAVELADRFRAGA